MNNLSVMLKLCQDMPLLQERLHRVGLHKTANKMQAAVEEIGFEVEHMIAQAMAAEKKV